MEIFPDFVERAFGDEWNTLQDDAKATVSAYAKAMGELIRQLDHGKADQLEAASRMADALVQNIKASQLKGLETAFTRALKNVGTVAAQALLSRFGV